MTDDGARWRSPRRVAELARDVTIDVARRPIDAVSHHVRVATRIAPGRPALWIGLRMVAAMAVPLALSPWLPPVIATSASLAGYFVTLLDKGGAYRTRARTMLLATAGAIVGVCIGVLVAQTPLAGPVVVLGFTLCSFAHIWGPNAASAANPAAVLLAIAAFKGAVTASLAEAVVGTAFGAAWAMLLALIVWPVRVYKPGRRAIAIAIGELAEYASELAGFVLGERDRAALLARHREIRDRLETARRTLVASQRGRGEQVRGDRLLALVDVTDGIFGRLLGIEDTLDALGRGPESERAARVLLASVDTLDDLADAVIDEKRVPGEPTAREALGTEPWDHQPLAVLVGGVVDRLAAARRLIASIADPSKPPPPAVVVPNEPAPTPELRDLVDLDSAVLRHALRVAIASALAVAVASAIHLAYAYWMLLTVFLLLQPYRSATITRTVQRALGTVAGALVAAALVELIHDEAVLIVITIAFAAIGASLLQLNFGLFSLFVTPTFVLLAEIRTQDFTLVGVRVSYTLIGGVIAVLASALLWPARERVLFDDLLADALETAADYVAAVRDAVATRLAMPAPEIARTRRLFGLALANAEVAIDRMIAERAAADLVEPRMAAIAFTRRLGGTINVLGTTRLLDDVDAQRAAIAAQIGTIEAQLRELAGASREHHAAGPAAPMHPLSDGPLVRSMTYLDALRSALERMHEVRA